MNRNTNRREFLKSAAVVAAAASTGVLSTIDEQADQQLRAAIKKDKAVKDEPIRIVDTHQHLWDLKKLKLPWLQGDAVQSINRNFVMSDYLKATKGLNVVKTVYMEVNVDQSHQVQEAEYVIDLCGRDDNPMVAAVIGGFPHDKGFKKYITRFEGSPYIKGVRTVLHDPDRARGLCLEPQFVESIQLLGKLGMSFDLCMRPDEIIDGVKLAKKCPKTRFIIDHCGNMSVESKDKKQREQWMKGMKAAAELENVVCKISGIVVTAKKDTWKPADLAPNMNFCMDTFGDDRIFFGGDWPVCTLKATYTQWVDALKWIVRDKPSKFKSKLFHDNAVASYGLDRAGT